MGSIATQHAGRINAALDTSEAARSALVASWRRSSSLHRLDPGEAKLPLRITDAELRLARARIEPLIHAAQSSLDRLYLAMSGVGCCVLLADRDGVPVDRRGAPGDDRTFEDWGLWTGTVWSEDAEGTNGIGTCLVEQRALTIHRDQHFFARNTALSCSTAPIYDHEGDLIAALDDPDSAVGLILTEFGVPESDTFPTRMADGATKAAKAAGKPLLAANFSTRHFSPSRMMRMEEAGVTVLDGLETSLAALGHLFGWRDRRSWPEPQALPEETRRRVGLALDTLGPADENAALDLLSMADVPVVDRHVVSSADEAEKAAAALGGPVVLKSAAALLHKTEADGVKLDLRDGASVRAAYNDLAGRLGPRVLVAPMVRGGVEFALGGLVDPVFGPVVMVGAGGTKAEILADRRFALAPVGHDEALAMIASLGMSRLLDPHRGKPGISRDAVAAAVSALSRLLAAFPERISEIDVNPLIATPDGVTAVDAVILTKNAEDNS